MSFGSGERRRWANSVLKLQTHKCVQYPIPISASQRPRRSPKPPNPDHPIPSTSASSASFHDICARRDRNLSQSSCLSNVPNLRADLCVSALPRRSPPPPNPLPNPQLRSTISAARPKSLPILMPFNVPNLRADLCVSALPRRSPPPPKSQHSKPTSTSSASFRNIRGATENPPNPQRL